MRIIGGFPLTSNGKILVITIHHHPDSTFARRVAMALIEKDIPHEKVLVDMAACEHRSKAYRALNPYERVPTLVDGGFVLSESTAILDYLEACFPAPALVPADRQGRALVAMHMKLCDLQMARQAGIVIFPRRFLPSCRRHAGTTKRWRSPRPRSRTIWRFWRPS